VFSGLHQEAALMINTRFYLMLKIFNKNNHLKKLPEEVTCTITKSLNVQLTFPEI
jgi:hypothetical protein